MSFLTAYHPSLVKCDSNALTTGAAPGQDPTPRGGGGAGALQTPKWLYGTIGFVGAGDFVLHIRQGEIFLSHSKYLEFGGEFKMDEKHKKDFDPDPTSGPDLG